MKEDIVKAVFIKYLRNLGKTPIPKEKNVPGPDVVLEGNAYECKGSRFEKDTLFRQLTINAFQYNAIGIVIPWDALDCLLIHKLEALEKLITTSSEVERSIEIYIVAEEEGAYYLRRWSSVGLFSWEIGKFIRKSSLEYMKLSPEEKVPKVLEFLKDFDKRMREYIKRIVVEEGRSPPNPWEAFSCTLEA